MPAVSGSVTQISTSAATAADLAGTPDDQFKNGDIAAVEALRPNNLFQLSRSSALVADNVNVIDTFSGNGQWISLAFASGGAMISVANLAALAALDASTVPENGLVWVDTLRVPFRRRTEVDPGGLDPLVAVRDNNNFVTWYREPSNASWVYEWNAVTDVHIDSATGDDENDGLTPGTSIATLQEASRRLAYDAVDGNVFLIFNVGVGGLTGYQVLTIPSWGYFEIEGTLTAAAVPTGTVAARQVRDRSTVPQTTAERQQATVNTNLWEHDVLYLNANTNQYGWALSGINSGAFGGVGADTLFATDPSVNDVINGFTLPIVESLEINHPGGGFGTIVVRQLDLQTSPIITNVTQAIFERCLLQGNFSAVNVAMLQLSNCRMVYGVTNTTKMECSGSVVLRQCIIEGWFRVACQQLELRDDCSINGAAGTPAIVQPVSAESDDLEVSPRIARFKNVELRDRAHIFLGDTNGVAGTILPAALDAYFVGEAGDIGYIYGVNDSVIQTPVQIQHAGIRLWYNGIGGAGTPTGAAATVVSTTTLFATAWSFENPGGADVTGAGWGAGLPDLSVSVPMTGIGRYL